MLQTLREGLKKLRRKRMKSQASRKIPLPYIYIFSISNANTMSIWKKNVKTTHKSERPWWFWVNGKMKGVMGHEFVFTCNFITK